MPNSKQAVFTFGRFNPPTIGHEHLIGLMAKHKDSDIFVYTSQSKDQKSNPLDYKSKIAILKKAFGQKVNVVADPDIVDIFDALEDLAEKNYSDIILVVGQDRVKEFSDTITKYIGKGTLSDIENFKVESAGDRDPESKSNIKSASASSARKFAIEGNWAEFKDIMPHNLSYEDKKKVYSAIRNVLKQPSTE